MAGGDNPTRPDVVGGSARRCVEYQDAEELRGGDKSRIATNIDGNSIRRPWGLQGTRK
jgi:hypothetical protein